MCSHLGILCSVHVVTCVCCVQCIWSPLLLVLSRCGHLCSLCSVPVVTCAPYVQCIWSPVQSVFSACGHLCSVCSVHVVNCAVYVRCVWSPVQCVFSVCGHLLILCSTVLLFTLRWEEVSAQVSTERRGFCSMLYPKIPTCPIPLKQPQIMVQVGCQHKYSQSSS